MSIHPIIKMGHPTLRQVAKTVAPEDIDSAQMHTLIADMIETLHDAGGIGLAAPQINQSIQLAIIEVPGGPSRYGEMKPIPLTVFFNPVLTVIDPEEAGYWEGLFVGAGFTRVCVSAAACPRRLSGRFRQQRHTGTAGIFGHRSTARI